MHQNHLSILFRMPTSFVIQVLAGCQVNNDSHKYPPLLITASSLIS